MPTLAEQLQELALCEQKALSLKEAIKNFVSQERIFDIVFGERTQSFAYDFLRNRKNFI